jgi:hypothetical protein
MRVRPAVLAVTAVAVVAIVASAVATIPSSSGTINGCYDAASGTPHPLTIVDDPADCKGGVAPTLLPFNQTGPQGAPGAQGPRGTIAGSHRVMAAVKQDSPPDGVSYSGTASCTKDEVLLGGGFDADRLAGTFDVVTSRPNADATGWDVKLRLTFPFGGTATFGSSFGHLLDDWRAANERTQEALAHSSFQALLDALRGHGPGGSQVTTKEVAKVRKAVGKAMARSDSSKRASTKLAAVVKDLTTPPHPPTQPPAAAGEGVYALCGA